MSKEIQLEHAVILVDNRTSALSHSDISQAISLKRIADSLEKLSAMDHVELTSLVTNLAWEAGRNFQSGLRTDR